MKGVACKFNPIKAKGKQRCPVVVDRRRRRRRRRRKGEKKTVGKKKERERERESDRMSTEGNDCRLVVFRAPLRFVVENHDRVKHDVQASSSVMKQPTSTKSRSKRNTLS